MAYIGSHTANRVSKTLTLLQRLTLSPALPRIPLAFLVHHNGFSSDIPPSEPPPASPGDPVDSDGRPRRPMRRQPEKLDETICYMMARRSWTTRLQNSIRAIVPRFDQPLVLGVLRGARRPEQALQFFRWVEKTGFRHDRHTYLEIISILTRNLMLNHARCILIDDMPKRAVDREEDMFIALINGYGRAGIPQEVVKIFQRMPGLGVQRTIRSYDAFFKAILRRGRVMMAKRYFNAMIRNGVAPTLSTYNTLLWGFCLCMKMDTANRFFDDMKERGIAPNIVTYNMLLNGWARAKKMDHATKVFAEMTGVGSGPNLISYNLMIKGYVSANKLDEALHLFNEMNAKGIKASDRTYAALLPGFCDDKERIREALKLLGQMSDRRITPKDQTIFLRMISTMCGAGDLDGALEVHKSMSWFRHVTIDTPHYSALIQGLCKGRKYDKAVEMLDELLAKGVLSNPGSSAIEASVYNPMMEYLCGNGLTNKAEDFFRQLMKRGVDDKDAFNHLIRGHATEEKPESAMELLNIMSRRGIAPVCDACTMLVESFLKKGEPADARAALDSMIEQGHLPSSSLFRSVMVALFDDGRVQTASRVMKSMIEKGVKENMDVVQRIVEALLVRGHVEEALGRINMLLMHGCAPDLDSLVGVLCDSGKTREAIKLVNFGLDRDCDMSFGSYDRLLDVLYSAGEILPAYAILCKIKAMGGVVDSKGCKALIKRLAAEGHTKQADILSRALSGKKPLEDANRGKKVSMDAQ